MAFRKRDFVRALSSWYGKHGRDLPWRRTRDPYAILVSELMLQQTQVASVVPYYANWLQRFPGFNTLARASENDVLHAWQGLGYYARARNLHATARILVAKYGGRCPEDIRELQLLPGIARYTAHAVATFAFDQPVGVVDANVARLLARLFNIVIPIDAALGRRTVWDLAAQLVDHHDPGRFNSALMDLGAVVCIPRVPKCGICPVQKFCSAKYPALLPIKRPRPQIKRLSEAHAFVLKRDKILLEQSRTRWRGMWILPRLQSQSKSAQPIHSSTFPFTHHRVKLSVFRQKPCAPTQQQRWFRLSEIDSIPMPSPHRRAIIDLVAKTNQTSALPAVPSAIER